jgi:hypothetical protein
LCIAIEYNNVMVRFRDYPVRATLLGCSSFAAGYASSVFCHPMLRAAESPERYVLVLFSELVVCLLSALILTHMFFPPVSEIQAKNFGGKPARKPSFIHPVPYVKKETADDTELEDVLREIGELPSEDIGSGSGLSIFGDGNGSGSGLMDLTVQHSPFGEKPYVPPRYDSDRLLEEAKEGQKNAEADRIVRSLAGCEITLSSIPMDAPRRPGETVADAVAVYLEKYGGG